MEIKINSESYRLLNNYQITEQAGATAVMSVNIKLDGKREPQPFDVVTISEEARVKGGDILLNGGVQDNVSVTDGTLELADLTPTIPTLTETYQNIINSVGEIATYGDLINGN